MKLLLVRSIVALGCLIGSIGWLSVFDLQSPFAPRTRWGADQADDNVVDTSLSDPSNRRPIPLTSQSIAYQAEKMRRFAQATSQPLLEEVGPDELRILVSWADFGETPTGVSLKGYIVRDGQVATCPVSYGKTLADPMNGHCGRPKSLRPDSALRDWSSVVGLGGFAYGCAVDDGWWVTIEGRRNDKWFLLTASNPDLCKDLGSKVIAALLDGR